VTGPRHQGCPSQSALGKPSFRSGVFPSITLESGGGVGLGEAASFNTGTPAASVKAAALTLWSPITHSVRMPDALPTLDATNQQIRAAALRLDGCPPWGGSTEKNLPPRTLKKARVPIATGHSSLSHEQTAVV
jgi:hypothetical protein